MRRRHIQSNPKEKIDHRRIAVRRRVLWCSHSLGSRRILLFWLVRDLDVGCVAKRGAKCSAAVIPRARERASIPHVGGLWRSRGAQCRGHEEEDRTALNGLPLCLLAKGKRRPPVPEKPKFFRAAYIIQPSPATPTIYPYPCPPCRPNRSKQTRVPHPACAPLPYPLLMLLASRSRVYRRSRGPAGCIAGRATTRARRRTDHQAVWAHAETKRVVLALCLALRNHHVASLSCSSG